MTFPTGQSPSDDKDTHRDWWGVIDRAGLLDRLAAGSDGDMASPGAESLTVLTPNLRLAASLAQEFDARQMVRGLSVWASADILSFSAWVERCYEDALYSELATSFAGGLPQVLAPAAEQHLWQDIVRASAWGGTLLAVNQTAAQCCASWQLAQSWRIAGAVLNNEPDAAGGWPCNEDGHAFSEWARAYEKRTAREALTDSARLPDWVARLLSAAADGVLRKPACIVVYAFDIVTPQQRALLDACAAAGIEVLMCRPGQIAAPLRPPARMACLSAREELERAAQWARARLESATSARAPRIGVVVPELQARRKDVLRVFSRVMAPRWNVPGADTNAPDVPFNISLGMPLSDYPVVDAALNVLALACSDMRHDGQGELDFAQVSRLIRSPFIGGAETELAARARLDAALRELSAPRLTLARLSRVIGHATDPERRGAVPTCALLSKQLAKLAATRMDAGASVKRAGQRSSSQAVSPGEWARHFSRLLEAMGFPGERGADSSEYQTIEKWRETLGELARLECVAPRLMQTEALAQLRRLCADTLFQPESTDKPVQILGILESAGLAFDHLWVSGLTDDAWPLAARPDPFIPPALQRKAGIPQAAAGTALELDARITADWQGAAAEVLFSHPRREGDRELICSPLIAAIMAVGWESLGVALAKGFRERIFEAGRVPGAMEVFVGDVAPRRAASDGAVRGGTRVLTDQAACPFRAFARHRLGAEALQVPPTGLDAAARGRMLHTLFARLWGELKSKAGLQDIQPEAFLELVDKAAAAAVARARAAQPDAIGDRLAELERARLKRLAAEWLEVEAGREDFQVIAIEDPRTLQAGGLAFRGRIDRMDRLADGSYALIDYKTGPASVSAWLGERPDDPQLPLYAVNAGENVSAVAFAKLRTGEMRFDGLARNADLLPKVRGVDTHNAARKHATSWDELVAGWRAELDALGQAFAAGDSRVVPKHLFKTCERCDLQPLCRVQERYSALEESDEDDDSLDADASADGTLQ